MSTLPRTFGFAFIAFLTLAVVGCSDGSRPAPSEDGSPEYSPERDSLRFAGEVHLRNVRQLTYGGNNAEAYWSYDNQQLVFQSDWDSLTAQGCDQIFMMNADGSSLDDGVGYRQVSTGLGRTTCAYFLPDGRIIYGSTHASGPKCPQARPFSSGRYVWPIFDSYDIYVANPDGSDTDVFIGGEGYDAEATVSPDGKYVVFTSTRSGDLELWRFEIETGALLQLTSELGYDGGAFFSHDSQKIVWRASRPQGEDARVYRELLAQDMVEPSSLNLFVADIDGANVRQITDLPGANWAPFFHPTGKKVIFATNHHTMAQGGREFDLFLVGVDGEGLTRITFSGTFDAFPMFSFDGARLAFASNRRGDRQESCETNVFVADWIEDPEAADLQFGD